MENQHRLIKTNRELSQEEIDLINQIKAMEKQCLALVNKVQGHLADTYNELDQARRTGSCVEEFNRFNAADPHRWSNIARTDIQTGFMALVRSVVQPDQ